MDLTTFKESIGLEDFDEFDIQIQSAIDRVMSKHTISETNYDEKVFLGVMCELETLNPELVGKADSYKIAGLSVVVNSIGARGSNLSFCKRYKILTRSGSFKSSSGARGGRG